MAYVLIENGVVVQKQPNSQPGFIEAHDSVVCGMLWDGETFTVPEPATAIPESITRRQGKIILSRYHLLDPVETHLANLEGQEGAEARIDYEDAQEWRRDWPLLVGLASQFGLSSAQIDQMFIEASQL